MITIMTNHFKSLVTVSLLALCTVSYANDKPEKPIGIVIHGGAGTILKQNMTPETEAKYREKLDEALNAGYSVLEQGGTSIEAVKTAIVIMEDSPLFNAGKGAVFTHEGVNELDASIMYSDDLSAGAVAGVSHIKNPILLADKVRTDSIHVMMAREGAEEFAKEQGFELVDTEYFFTQRRWDQLQKVLKHTPEKPVLSEDEAKNSKFGTVGAVALDKAGNIAAATSTGGMTNKRYGRIGDSPIIGAGTYADKNCGVSATGHGEYFIRAVVTYDICARVKYKEQSIQQSADEVIHQKLIDMGGDGGVIGLDASANIMTSFNTEGMYRAWKNNQGASDIKIYKDE